MKSHLFIVLLALSLFSSVQAQYSQLLHKPYREQVEILSDLYYSANHGGITLDGLADTLAGMRELGRRENDPNLLQEADLLEVFYMVFNAYEPIDRLIKFQQESEAKGFHYIASRAANAISSLYWEDMEFEKSIRWHLMLEEMIRDMSIEDFPDKAIFLQQIGNDFLFFGDYRKAISYFRRVAELPLDEFYIYAYRHTFNNLGLSYREIGNLDSSDYFYEKLLIHADTTSEQWVGIASGNYGYNHLLRGDIESAVNFLEKDLVIAEKFGDLGLAAGSCITLASISIEKGNLPKAKGYLDKALDYIQKSGQRDRYAKLFPVMSKWESVNNNPQLANAYLDSALVYQKRVSEKFSALQLMRANQEVMASQREKEILALNEEVQRNKVTRNFIIGGLGLMLVGFLVIYRVRNERNKAEQKLKNIALEKAHSDLENARNLLKSYVNKINNNSKIISSLEESMPTSEQQELLNELKESTILTEADWENFQKQFTKVFPGLIENLLKQYPNLSPAEVRFLLLTKLEMPAVDIANALGVSPATLRVTWYRIRKKLDLPKDSPFSSFFENHFSEA
jgi:tetratricopeptide (TPR) repeat protein